MTAVPVQAKPKGKHKVRENVEAFAIAILVTVLLKPLVVEAYQIPTSSMQPTLMGSDAARVYDRIIVDKLRYAMFEPARWDIAVFRYPIRQNQSYVKRIVGIGGDRLRIAGGNLNFVGGDGAIVETLRKPDELQDVFWKEVYPARRLMTEGTQPFDRFWNATGRWSERDDVFTVEVADRAQARLVYHDDALYGGLVNRIFDGYPTSVARAILADYPRSGLSGGGSASDWQGVQDVKLAFDYTPERAGSVRLELEVSTADTPRRFALEIDAGEARLKVYVKGREEAASPPFPYALTPGAATRIAFAHVDDRLLAWRDGVEVQSFATDAHRIVTPIERGKTTVALHLVGGGSVRVGDLRLWRDQHWTTSRLAADHVIEVPEGHFFMMGDNTLQSEDARDWTAVTVAVLPDGTIADPKAHPDAPRLVGNRRPGDLEQPPGPDENPVLIRSRDRVAFTDLPGEVWPLHATISPATGQRDEQNDSGMLFGAPGAEWAPPTHKARFVPREHVLGRAFLVFWPIWPIGPQRFGLVK